MTIKIKARLKISVDILMIMLFLFTLISLSFSNIRIHEIVGLITIVLVAAHLVLNWNWIKVITKNLFKRKLNKKAAFRYVMFILLTISFIASIVSGIAISTFIHPSGVEDDSIFIHTAPSALFLILCIVHFIQHFGYLKSKIFGKKKEIKNTKHTEIAGKENEIITKE